MNPQLTSPPKDTSIREEKRFAVVMYGGVSLAIYINGIAQELYRLVKSTATDVDPKSLTGSQRIYRELADKLKAKFVVDILAGTSAGGINAIFLAKALANGQSLDGLQSLWVTEGNIEVLVNDRKSIRNDSAAKEKHGIRNPTSLLNGHRLYAKLRETLNDMDVQDGIPLVDNVDLFVTATDVQGLSTPMRLSDEVVCERRHRNVFHFRKADKSSDFTGDNNEFLAFAGRCTSSFPIAFEPVCLADVATPRPHWQRFYRRYLDPERPKDQQDPFPSRAFVDGGYLDNKPFTYAIETIAERYADVPVDRKLIYIEPNPENVSRDWQPVRPPNAIENALKAFTLARYETIREDLDLIRKRNRLVERADRILRGTDEDIERLKLQNQPVNETQWLDEGLEGMIDKEGTAYAGYLRLRVAQLTDDLSRIIAIQAGFDTESDEFLAVRYLVRAWRNDRYAYYIESSNNNEKKHFNRFIRDYDFAYHIRRLSFVLSKIDHMLLLDEEGCRIFEAYQLSVDQESHSRMVETLRPLRSEFSRYRADVRELQSSLRSPPSLDQPSPLAEAVWSMAHRKDLIDLLRLPSDRARLDKAKKMIDDKATEIDTIVGEINTKVDAANKTMRRCKETLGLHDGEINVAPRKRPDTTGTHGDGAMAEWITSFYFRMFPKYDLISYPILQTPGVEEEFDRIEVIRIHPPDPRKLGGVRFHSFGAFFDQTWRKNDILRGRLDGAERLISSLVQDERERKDFVTRAHQAIVAEILHKDGSSSAKTGTAADDIAWTDLMSDVLLGATHTERKKVRQGIKHRGGKKDNEIDQHLGKLVKRDIKPEALCSQFQSYQVSPDVDPELVATTAARSTRVLGKVLTGIADDYEFSQGKRFASRIATVGTVASGLVEALLPATWQRLIFQHWLKLLSVFAMLLLIGSLVFPELRQISVFSVSAIVVLIFVKLIDIALQRAIRIRKLGAWLDIPVVVAKFLLFVLLVIGVVYMRQAAVDSWAWSSQHIREFWDGALGP